MHNPRTRKFSRILKRIGCRKQGFPERELPRFRKEASILRTETFGPHSEQLGHICGSMTRSEVETHARRLGTEDTETHAEGLRSSAGAQENSLPHSSCPKTLTQKSLTKNSSLQQKLAWLCTRPELFQHGSFAWCQILEQPVATLMQRTDHPGRLAGAIQFVSHPADKRVKVSNSKLRSHS